MKGKILLRAVFGTCLLLFATSALANETIAVDEWLRLEETVSSDSQREIQASFGLPEKSSFDDLLSVEITEYRIGKNDEKMLTGEIFYTAGIVMGLRTRFSGDGRDVLRRFVAKNKGYILTSGDLYAIAGSSESCDLYRAVEVDSEGALVYLMHHTLYRRMVILGDLPPLPTKDGRKGYAA